MKFSVVRDPFKEETELFNQELVKWCQERNIEVEPGTGKNTIVLALGGDGFIMREAKRLQKSSLPVLGVNFGRKGILAAVEKENWQENLSRVIRGEYKIERRLMLTCDHLDGAGRLVKRIESINDIYIRHPKRMVIVGLRINGEVVHKEVHADGVVICTPMGSTAYFRTSGGSPFPSGIGVNFICPMEENLTALIQTEGDVIEVTLSDVGSFKKEPAFLFVDGEDSEIKVGEMIRVRKSKKKARFVIPRGFSWFHVAQRKLGLSY